MRELGLGRRALAWVIAALLGALTATAAQATLCTVADPTGTPLNLRASPNGAVVGTIGNGLRVEIVGSDVHDGKPWSRVRGPGGNSGWVIARYLRCGVSGESARPALIPIPTAARPCIVADPTGTPLNLRDAPEGSVIGRIGNGTSVVLGAQSADERWARVARADGSPLGWVFRNHLDCRAPAPPVIEARPSPKGLSPGEATATTSPVPAAPPGAASGSAQVLAAPIPPAAARPTPAERRVALVIGNGAYATAPALANPARDAATFGATLRRLGFDTVVLRENLGSAGMREALRAFAAEAEGADWAVVYFAGHGLEIGGTNYLVPVDARLASDRDVPFEAITLDQVLGSVEGARKLQLVILDACRNNPFLAGMKRSVAARSAGRGLARVEPEGSQLVAFAAKAGQTALDGAADSGNSPFMTALVRNMALPNTEIRKLFGLVRDDVLAQTDRAQEPAIYGSLGGADYYFLPQAAR